MAPPQRPSLRGVVRAVGDSGRPVEGAEVSIAKRSATTDAQGRFRIEGIPAGIFPSSFVASDSVRCVPW